MTHASIEEQFDNVKDQLERAGFATDDDDIRQWHMMSVG